jgi:hypothetical protein
MLPEPCRQLLTAYVDGELSARQRRQALRLLRRSGEARQYLTRLQSDSRELRGLPSSKPEIDLSGPVLAQIASRRLTPGRAPAVRAYPAWLGYAAAAAILVAVAAASYGVVSASFDRPSGDSLAVSNPQGANPDGPSSADAPRNVATAPPPDKQPDNDKPDGPRPPTDSAKDKPDRPRDPKPDDPGSMKEDDAFTYPGLEIFTPLESPNPKVDLPVAFALRELDQEAKHKNLLAELQKGEGVRIELPCPDGTRAYEHLQAVFKAHHVSLTIDATAQRRLAHPQWKTNYVLYAEDVTPDELALLLQQLVAEDKKAGKAVEPPFESMVLTHLSDRDHKELADLLNIDPAKVRPPSGTGPLGVDPHKSPADQTLAQLTATLEGQGGAPPRPEPGKSPGAKPADKDKAVEHAMLVMPYNPVRPKRDSAEVKRFLDDRKPMRTGALQVLLVLRGVVKS